MQRPTFLEFGDYRYLKLSGLVSGVAILGYWLARPAGGEAYGGTWFGYLLGISAALLVLLLAAYGVRKRNTPIIPDRRKYARRKLIHAPAADGSGARSADRRKKPAEDYWRFGGTLRGWLSAHVYLGIALLVLTSLHAGFRLDWNVHGLAYALVLLVVASGLYGTFAYLHHPRLIAENIGGHTLDGLLLEIAELDEMARLRALDLPDEINALVTRARQDTRLGGNFLQRLGGGQRGCPTAFAAWQVEELGKTLVAGDQPKLMRDLYAVLLQKQRLVAIARREIALNARMRAWLYLHMPLTIALLAALLAHVISILVYW